MTARASSCHCCVNRVTVEPDRPAAEPTNCSNAGTKSPDDNPCSYSNGNTCATCGDLRAHAGKIAQGNRRRVPLT